MGTGLEGGRGSRRLAARPPRQRSTGSDAYRTSAPALSLVVPFLDEAENLPVLVSEIRAALRDRPESWELILVDDGSQDGGAAVANRLAAEDPRILALAMDRNRGQSAALVAGFHAASGGIIVTLDADLQNDPADIPHFLEQIDHWDVVCGVREGRRDSWVRRLSSRIANAVRNRVTGESIADIGCSLRAMRREQLSRVPVFDGMHRFLPTLLRLQGATVTEMPVHHRPRLHGRSKYGISNRLWRGIRDLLGVRWLQHRAIDPQPARDLSTVNLEGLSEGTEPDVRDPVRNTAESP